MQLIRAHRSMAIDVQALDSDPWILNTPTGIVDLRTGVLSPSDPAALCSKTTAVGMDAALPCPLWQRFIAETTGGDAELISFLQRLCGYSLTGLTQEQALTFIWGPGGNGKSVFLNVVSDILGDYAQVATMDTFTASSWEKHSTDIAMLNGARFVSASETARGKHWDEQRLKSLTGGEPVTARFMRQDNFTYVPRFKLVFVGNHRPELSEVDDALRRRIHIVPFTRTPAEADPELCEKLRAEWPAILAWMVKGCLEWRREELNPPAVVRALTEQYFLEQDAIGEWLEEECELRVDAFTTTMELFGQWRSYCKSRDEPSGSLKLFSQSLANRGFHRGKHPQNRRNGFYGVALRYQDTWSTALAS